MAQFAGNSEHVHWAETSPPPSRLNGAPDSTQLWNRVPDVHIRDGNSAQAVVGSTIWVFRRFKARFIAQLSTTGRDSWRLQFRTVGRTVMRHPTTREIATAVPRNKSSKINLVIPDDNARARLSFLDGRRIIHAPRSGQVNSMVFVPRCYCHTSNNTVV